MVYNIVYWILFFRGVKESSIPQVDKTFFFPFWFDGISEMGLHIHILVSISVFFLFISIEFVDLTCRYGISCDCNMVSRPYSAESLLHCDNSTIQDQIGLYIVNVLTLSFGFLSQLAAVRIQQRRIDTVHYPSFVSCIHFRHHTTHRSETDYRDEPTTKWISDK